MRRFSAPTGWSALSCFWGPSWIGCCETRNAEVGTRNRRASAGRACSAFRVSRSAFSAAPPAAGAPQALPHPEPSRAVTTKLPVILAITGASGAPYGVRLLELLAVHQVPTWLLVSAHGWRLLAEECGITDDRGLKKATGGDWTSIRVFDDKDRGAEPASGSAKTAGMVICPCSMGTVAAIAHGTSRSLIERAADVVLKERRRLIVVPPDTTHILIEHIHDSRRIHTDGRDWPADMDDNPMFRGYSIGRWIDEDGDGHYDVLVVETRGLKNPRTYDVSGIPFHADGRTVIKERIYLDKADPNFLHDEITVTDNALTRPWTVTKNYRRVAAKGPIWWREDVCAENNVHVVIGKEDYFLSADGLLMPTKKDQPPPDLKYFNRSG